MGWSPKPASVAIYQKVYTVLRNVKAISMYLKQHKSPLWKGRYVNQNSKLIIQYNIYAMS